MEDLIKRCGEEFSLRSYPIIRSNELEPVRNKAALFSALSIVGGLSDRLIAKSFKYDRTTVLHHRRKHEENMKYVHGYSLAFTTASSVVQRVLLTPYVRKEVSTIDAQIRQLKQLKQSLINKLES
jgi:hypothetical protein